MHSVAVMLALGAGVLAVSLATPLEAPEIEHESTQYTEDPQLVNMQVIHVNAVLPDVEATAPTVPPRVLQSGAVLPPMSRQKRQILGGGLGAGMAGAQAQSQAQSMGGGMGLGGMGGMGFPYMMGMPFLG